MTIRRRRAFWTIPVALVLLGAGTLVYTHGSQNDSSVPRTAHLSVDPDHLTWTPSGPVRQQVHIVKTWGSQTVTLEGIRLLSGRAFKIESTTCETGKALQPGQACDVFITQAMESAYPGNDDELIVHAITDGNQRLVRIVYLQNE